MSGPSETGKTIAALYKLDTLARQYPKARGAIVRKVRADMDGTVLDLFGKLFVEPAGDIQVFGGEKPEFYRYQNGTKVFVGGMDRPGKVLSGALDFAYVNQTEELDLADWETLSTRTTGRAGVIVPGLLFGDCNPAQASHWILARGLTLLRSRHEDNPSLFDAQGNITEQGKLTLAVLDALTGVRYKRYRLGQWANVEGAVYDSFDKAIHVVDRFPIPAEWRRIGAVDWGFTNPGVLHIWAVDGDGRMYLEHEVYQTHKTIDWWIEQARQFKVDQFVCDPSEPGFIQQFNDAGLYADKADNDISPGIQAVQERLKIQGDGKARLYFFRDALVERDESLAARHLPVCTADEAEVYQWPKGADGKALKEKPLDMNNHGMDTMRYAAMYAGESHSLFAWGGNGE